MRVLITASAFLLTLMTLALVPAQEPKGEYVKKATRAESARATLVLSGRAQRLAVANLFTRSRRVMAALEAS